MPLLFLLAALPALVGCSQGVSDRSPRVAGEVERVPVLDAARGTGGPTSADLLSPPAAPSRSLAGQPGAGTPGRQTFERMTLTGSPDGPSVSRDRLPSTGSDAPTNEDVRVLTEVNRLRALHSLAPIRFDARLFRAAQSHSEEQLASNYLGHGSPDPERARLSQRLTQGGYLGRMYAEVVASNYGDAVSVVEAWMQSAAHRTVLLDPELSEGAFSRVSNPADPRVNRWTGDFGAPVLARATGPGTPTPAARSTSVPGSQAAAAPSSARPGTSTGPYRQPLAPPANSRVVAQPAPKLVAPVPPACTDCPGGKCGVPAPVFGSDSGFGRSLPAPRAGTPTAAPGTYPATPPVYVAPRVQQPAYVAPTPVPYRAPVIIRRPAPRQCKT